MKILKASDYGAMICSCALLSKWTLLAHLRIQSRSFVVYRVFQNTFYSLKWPAKFGSFAQQVGIFLEHRLLLNVLLVTFMQQIFTSELPIKRKTNQLVFFFVLMVQSCNIFGKMQPVKHVFKEISTGWVKPQKFTVHRFAGRLIWGHPVVSRHNVKGLHWCRCPLWWWWLVVPSL